MGHVVVLRNPSILEFSESSAQKLLEEMTQATIRMVKWSTRLCEPLPGTVGPDSLYDILFTISYL